MINSDILYIYKLDYRYFIQFTNKSMAELKKTQQHDGLKNGSYFYIINQDKGLALTYNTDDFNPKLQFSPFHQSSPDQIWMIQETQQNRYEIVHAYSTLVLTVGRQSAKLSYGNQNSNQLFFLQKSNPLTNSNEYWIRETKSSDNYLFIDIGLKCNVVNEKADKARWQLKKIDNSNDLLKSCLIQFAYSGLYVDIPGSSIKEGLTICQYTLNARCNQRWKIKEIRNTKSFMIISVRSKLCLSVKKNNDQAGAKIVQQNAQNGNQGQLWKLNHIKGSLYIIESALKSGLFLGIQQNSMNENANLTTTTQEEYAYWRIIGQIQNEK